MTTCPYRDRCTVSAGNGNAVTVAAMKGYRCGFEIVGTVRHCPKIRQFVQSVMVGVTSTGTPSR